MPRERDPGIPGTFRRSPAKARRAFWKMHDRAASSDERERARDLVVRGRGSTATHELGDAIARAQD